MSINQSFAFNSKKTDKFGKYFTSIDFELNDSTNSAVIQQKKYSDIIAGELIIDNHRYKMTLAELDRISETALAAKETFIKKYQLGFYGK